MVAAYGKILPLAVLETPKRGCLNLHPSLSPRHRGPSPVSTAILEGDSVTGVTLMLLDEGMDTGPIIATREHRLTGQETAETLTWELFQSGAQLLLHELDPWMAGKSKAEPQDDSLATVTKKLERQDGHADWQLSAIDLERRSRAFTPWPGLFTTWRGKTLKLLDVSAIPGREIADGHPGRVVSVDGAPVAVVSGEGLLALNTLQLEGRRPVTAAEFLRGHPQIIGASL